MGIREGALGRNSSSFLNLGDPDSQVSGQVKVIKGQSYLISLHHGIETLENLLFFAQILCSGGPLDSTAKLANTRKEDSR